MKLPRWLTRRKQPARLRCPECGGPMRWRMDITDEDGVPCVGFYCEKDPGGRPPLWFKQERQAADVLGVDQATVSRDLGDANESSRPPARIELLDRLDADASPRPHISQAAGDNEWYTPPEYIAAARKEHSMEVHWPDLDGTTAVAAVKNPLALAVRAVRVVEYAHSRAEEDGDSGMVMLGVSGALYRLAKHGEWAAVATLLNALELLMEPMDRPKWLDGLDPYAELARP